MLQPLEISNELSFFFSSSMGLLHTHVSLLRFHLNINYVTLMVSVNKSGKGDGFEFFN